MNVAIPNPFKLPQMRLEMRYVVRCVRASFALFQVGTNGGCSETAQYSRCKHRRTDSTVGLKAGWCEAVCVCVGLWCVLVFFRENGFCISALVSSSSPPSPSLPHSCPSIPLSLSSYYSHSALEGRQRTLNALCCLLHCLCCFSAPVPHSLPIFVFINHNGCLLRVS